MVNSVTNCTVDWGDGTPVATTPVNNTITGTVAGKYVTIKAYGLNYLDCSEQEVTSLSFTNATGLETLIASNNNLTGLIANGLTGLKHLWCDNNSISTLYLRPLTQLETLVASNNALTSLTLPAGGTTTLTDYWVDSNNLNNIVLTGCSSLRTLNVENNNLTKMTLPVLDAKAEQVFLDGNSLDFTSFWNKANVANWYGIKQTFNFAEESYKVGQEFSIGRNISGNNQDGTPLSYTNYTYTWFPYSADGEKGEKLVRGASGNTEADYTTPNIGAGKDLFTFNKPFDDVQLEIKCNRYTDFLLVSDHISIVDDQTGIYEQSIKNNLSFTVGEGAITLQADAPTEVKIFDTAGQLCWQGKVYSPTRLQLPKGIYLVNKIKISL